MNFDELALSLFRGDAAALLFTARAEDAGGRSPAGAPDQTSTQRSNGQGRRSRRWRRERLDSDTYLSIERHARLASAQLRWHRSASKPA